MQSGQNLVMPKLGLTMTEGLLAEWKVKPGDRVVTGDIICVVETEKIANEVEAPCAGQMISLVVPEGTTVPVGTTIATWTGAEIVGSDRDLTPPTADAEPAAGIYIPSPNERILSTPLARRLSRQSNVDLASVVGSGPGGRIKAADVRAALSRKPSDESLADGAFIPANGVQLAIAKRLSFAKRDIPHFYVATEADVAAALSLREQLNSGMSRRVTLTHVVVCAVARALSESPNVNRVWRDSGFLNFGSIDVGIAVQTDRGLMAPVLRHADRMDLDEISESSSALIERGRTGRLTLDDLDGGALTVSNVGMHNVTYLTPIVNPGQTAILGVGSVRDTFRPGARGEPVLKRELGLVLAADHRVSDGVEAAKFLNRIVHHIENPVALMRKPQ
jgi:pyruvate dehydrogenase E2 component (dihydrolipoamide acetyltransferase)